ncbi:MAG: hypothetical protein AB7L66_00530 [Gemmatimonadales bacterium]
MLAYLFGAAIAAADPSGLLVVANKAENSVTVIDLASGRQITRMPTGTGPHEVAVSPDGRWAVATNYGDRTPGNTLAVFDLPGRRVEKTIDLGEYRRPHGAVFLPDGRLMVTSETSQALVFVDVAAGVVLGSAPTNARTSHLAVVPADGRHAYSANITDGSVTEVDLATARPTRSLPVATQTEGVAVTPDGGTVWLASRNQGIVVVVDIASWRAVDTLGGMRLPYRVNAAPDGSTMVVSDPEADSLLVFDARTRKRLGAVGTGAGSQPVGGAVSRDGRYAYIALQARDEVVEVDLVRFEITRRLPVGSRPDGVAVWSAGIDSGRR